MHGPFGKIVAPLPVERGGTDAVTETAARSRLDVPTLSGNNVLTGINSFEGQTATEGLDVNGTLAVYGGMTVDTDDPATFSAAPTVGGTALVADAPSDGKYYVRKDGAWVEIIP